MLTLNHTLLKLIAPLKNTPTGLTTAFNLLKIDRQTYLATLENSTAGVAGSVTWSASWLSLLELDIVSPIASANSITPEPSGQAISFQLSFRMAKNINFNPLSNKSANFGEFPIISGNVLSSDCPTKKLSNPSLEQSISRSIWRIKTFLLCFLFQTSSFKAVENFMTTVKHPTSDPPNLSDQESVRILRKFTHSTKTFHN